MTAKPFFINLSNSDGKTRYDLSKFLEFTDFYDGLNSIFLDKLTELKKLGSYVITSNEHRPELISYDIYGDTQYYWIVMLYNNIFDFEDLSSGTVINYPDLDDLESLYFSLKSLETASEL